jgi:hypothetical protein
MSDYLTRLARKALGREPVLLPRLPGLFEPSAVGGSMGEAASRSEGLSVAEPPARTAADRRPSPFRPRRVAPRATPASPPQPAAIHLPTGEKPPPEASPVPVRGNRPAPALEETAALPGVARPVSWPQRMEDDVSPPGPPSGPAAGAACPAPLEAPPPEPFTRQPQPSSAAGPPSTPVDRLSVHEPPRIEGSGSTRLRVAAAPAPATAALPLAAPAPPPTRSEPRAAKIQISPPPAPAIRVSIGRVEVRLVAPPAPASPSPPSQPKPAMSLDDYLRGRHGGRA